MSEARRKAGRLGIFLLLALGVIALDQGVKLWTRNTLAIGESWRGGPLPGIFEITLTYNKGVAFGAMEGYSLFAAPVALAIAAACGVSAWRGGGPLKIVALALMASGALGNMFDRIFDRRGVTDMFLVRLANLSGGRVGDFPVFNVADAAITVAVILLAWTWLREGERKPALIAATPGEASGDVPTG